MEGNPLPLLEQIDNKLVLNENTLTKVFLNKDIKNKRIAILSISGVERSGKSFILNYFLRYLRSNDFGEHDEDLKGFDWRSGTIAQTKGICIWSKPFLRKINEEEIAIFVVDTQGAFGEKKKDDNIIIPFSLSVSTLHIFNVMNNLNSIYLEPLELFLNSVNTKTQVFKNLVIIVRDWTQSTRFGFVGGKAYLIQKIISRNTQDYRYLTDNYESTSCYLCPPHLNEICDDHFKGRLSEIDDRYVKHLKAFIPKVIEDLLIGTHLTGVQLLEHMTKSFQAICENKPIYSLCEVHIKIKVSDMSDSILNKTKTALSGYLKEIHKNMDITDSDKLEKTIAEREKIMVIALKEFEDECSQYGDIFRFEAEKLEKDLCSCLDYLERQYDGLLVDSSICKLKKYNSKVLELLCNRNFFKNLFTKEEYFRQGSKYLENIVEEEIKKYPVLIDCLSGSSIIDFADNLNISLQNVRKRRVKVAAGALAAISCVSVGGLMGYRAFGGMSEGACELVKNTAKAAVKESIDDVERLKNIITTTSSVAAIDSALNFILNQTQSNENTIENINTINRKNMDDFLVVLKETITTIVRFLSIGGDLTNVVERAKLKKEFVEKSYLDLLLS